VVDGAGVWTNVEGDAVAMTRGDLLLTPGWHFHEHHNTTDHPMAWIDGLDIPARRPARRRVLRAGLEPAGDHSHAGALAG